MKTICSIEGCGNPHLARGWCERHYRRWRRHGDPLAGSTSWGVPMQWLRDHLDHTGDECLIWPFARGAAFGYGRIYADGETTVAHRLMCEHRHGPPPTPRHEAAHNCGNGHLGCVNGGHLRWATPKENHADKLIHGTHDRGERNSQAKLTEADVAAIRSRVGISYQQIAKQFGVSATTVWRVKRRLRWAWLEQTK